MAKDDISKMGYRDDSPYRDEPFIDINTPDGTIDMSETGIPLMANGRYLPPYSGMHQFEPGIVREEPMHQMPDGSWMPGENHGDYEEMELTDEEIEEYRRGGYVVEEMQAGGESTQEYVQNTIPVTDPNDPRLHMYLDSLNLFKGYQKEQELFPEEPVPGGTATRWQSYLDERKAKGMDPVKERNLTYYDPKFKDPEIMYHDSFDDYWKLKAKRDQVLDEYRDASGNLDFDKAAKDQRLTDLGWNDKMDAFKTTKDLWQDDTKSGKLAKYYADELRFKHPTSVGYWHSPDLGSSKIAPSDSYFGEAWNPVYKKPTQPYNYVGNPHDVAALRHPAAISGVTRWAGKPAGTTDPRYSVAVNLRKRGMDSSFAARKTMAEEAGIEDYKGTKEQNIALNDYVFTNYEGDKKKEAESKGDIPKMEGEDIPPLAGLKAIRETVATPDPAAPEEIKKKMTSGKAPRVVSYTQKWDPQAKKWTQQPVIQEVAVAPGQYQNGGGPIYTNDPNDPKLKAYRDSSDAYAWGKEFYREHADNFNKTYEDQIEQGEYYLKTGQSEHSLYPDLEIGTLATTGSYDGDILDPMAFPIFRKPTQPVKYKKKPPKIEHIKRRELTSESDTRNINTTLRKGVPKLPEPTIIGYTQAWDPANKKWTQEPIYETISEADAYRYRDYAYGGEPTGEVKARLAYEYMHGNPAVKRMMSGVDNPYVFPEGHREAGNTGTHFMTSQGNYAVPSIQEQNGQLILNEDFGPSSNEAIRFDNPDTAKWFAENNYKKFAAAMDYEDVELSDEEIEEYRRGGYIVEELPQAQSGLSTSVNMPNYVHDPNPVFFKEDKHPSGVPLPTKDTAGTLKKTKKQPILEKVYDVASNPMTALAESRGGLPDYIGAAVDAGTIDRNPLDMAVDVINPVAYANLAGDVYHDVEQGNYTAAAFNAATMVPGIGTAGKVAKQAHKAKLLKNLEDPARFNKFLDRQLETGTSVPWSSPVSRYKHNIGQQKVRPLKEQIGNIQKQMEILHNDKNIQWDKKTDLLDALVDTRMSLQKKIDNIQLDYNEGLSKRLGLPLNFRDHLGKGHFGSVWTSTLDPNLAIKIGKNFPWETEETFKHMVDVGKKLDNPKVGLPKKAFTIGDKNKHVFHMDKLPKGTDAVYGRVNPKAEHFDEYLNTLKDLENEGVFLDYIGKDNVRYVPGEGYYMMDMFTTPEGFDPLGSMLIDRYGKEMTRLSKTKNLREGKGLEGKLDKDVLDDFLGGDYTLPFQKGGAYEEMDLTDDQIAEMRSQGYIIEEL